MSKHTKEPWTASGTRVLHEDESRTPDAVARTDLSHGIGAAGETDRANARRIAACVNACAGIPTEALEAGVVAEMLAALKRLDEVDCCTGYSLGDDSYRIFWEALEMARAILRALAKAEGGAA